MEGKSLVIYGSNRTGKTLNVSKANKVLFLSFEKGLNAINNVPFFYIDKWSKFTNIVKQLCSPNTVEEAKKHYSTIVIDTIQGISELADEYICTVFNIGSVGAGNGGYGNWKEYAKEWYEAYQPLLEKIYNQKIVGHKSIGDKVYQTDYENGISVIVNYSNNDYVKNGVLVCKAKYFAELGGDNG